jgi:hypothetical protein
MLFYLINPLLQRKKSAKCHFYKGKNAFIDTFTNEKVKILPLLQRKCIPLWGIKY